MISWSTDPFLTEYFTYRMDAAGQFHWQPVTTAQQQVMGEQLQQIAELNAKIDLVSQALVSAPQRHMQPPVTSSPITIPEQFLDEDTECKGFFFFSTAMFSVFCQS